MHIVHVFVHAKPEHLEAFRAATIENAKSSVKEPGIARFDVIQQADDPTRFVLIEVYHTPEREQHRVAVANSKCISPLRAENLWTRMQRI